MNLIGGIWSDFCFSLIQPFKRFASVFVMAFCLFFVAACGGSSGDPQTDVYVAGVENENGVDVAKYWKNGAEVKLTDGSNDASASSIYVSGSDVYAAGFENESGVPVAKYWKNGAEVKLTDGSNTASAYSIYVYVH